MESQKFALVSGHDFDEIEFVGTKEEVLTEMRKRLDTCEYELEVRYATAEGHGQWSLGRASSWIL